MVEIVIRAHINWNRDIHHPYTDQFGKSAPKLLGETKRTGRERTFVIGHAYKTNTQKLIHSLAQQYIYLFGHMSKIGLQLLFMYPQLKCSSCWILNFVQLAQGASVFPFYSIPKNHSSSMSARHINRIIISDRIYSCSLAKCIRFWSYE